MNIKTHVADEGIFYGSDSLLGWFLKIYLAKGRCKNLLVASAYVMATVIVYGRPFACIDRKNRIRAASCGKN